MKFLIGLGLCTMTMFGSMFIVRANHFDDQKMACIQAGGDGKLLYSSFGIPFGYKCMRMHKVLKYKQGVYK